MSSAVYSIDNDTMILSILSDIDAKCRFIASLSNLTPFATTTLTEIERRRSVLEAMPVGGISEGAAWAEAYRLERMMVLVEPTDTLISETQMRLGEAAAEAVSALPRLNTAFLAAQARAVDTTTTPPAVRASEANSLRLLLLEVLSEICWTKQRKFYGRPIQKSVTRRIVFAGIFSFLLFIVPYLFIYKNVYSGVDYDKKMLTSLPLWTALTAGLFGAYFSRLMFIQTNAGTLSIGELKTAREWTSILLRGCVGMCGALIVFLFLRAGIVSGSVFPKFEMLGVVESTFGLRDSLNGEPPSPSNSLTLILPRADLALLALWCFLAGFSERLVPSILSSTEEQFEAASRPKAP